MCHMNSCNWNEKVWDGTQFSVKGPKKKKDTGNESCKTWSVIKLMFGLEARLRS